MAEAVGARKKKVMVAMDDSEPSEQALEWAIKNLGPDMELVIYTVQTPVYVYDVSFSSVDLIRDLEESERRHALAVLEKAKTICSRYGIVADYITDVGDPKRAICKAVETLNIQLLVVGSHGRGALTSAFLGSVSNYCVNHAKCPVLVVRKTG